MPTETGYKDPFAGESVVSASKKSSEPSEGYKDPFMGETITPAPKSAEIASQEASENVERPVPTEVGALEAATSLATGMISSTIGGLAGVGALAQGYSGEQAADLIKATQKKFTYQPRTEKGQQLLELAQKPFELYGEFSDYMADTEYEATGSPALATAVKTGYEAIPALFGPQIVKGTAKAVTAPSRTVLGVAKKVLSKAEREKFVQERAINEIKKDVVNLQGLEEEAGKVKIIQDKIPGFKPTLAETTASRALIAKQRQLDVESSAALEQAVSRKRANNIAIQNFLDDSFGRETGNINKVFREAKGSVDDAVGKLQSQIDTIQAKREALIEAEPVSKVAVGKQLRELADSEYQLAKAKGNALYNKIGDAPIDSSLVYRQTERAVKEYFSNYEADKIPPIIRDILGEHKELMKTAKIDPATGRSSGVDYTKSLKEMRSLDRRLGEEIASESSSLRPNMVNVKALAEIKESLNKSMDRLETADNKGVVESYREAKRFWREEVADKFYRGVGKRIRDSRYGEWNIADEKIIDEIFSAAKMKTGGVKAAQEFKAIYGENPEAMAQLNLGVMQKFRDFPGLIKDGAIDPKRLDVFKDKYRDVLSEFPRIRQQIDTLGNANQALADAQRVIINKKSTMEREAFTKAMNTDDPNTIVTTALKNPQIMRRLKSSLRTEEAKMGLSKIVSDELIKEATKYSPLDGKEYIDAGLMYKNLRQYKDSIPIGLTPQHFKALADAYQALTVLDRVKLPEKPTGAGMLGEQFTEAVGSSPRSILNMLRAKHQGRTSGVDISSVIAGGLLNKLYKKRIFELERAAHYDMEAAQVLKQLATSEKMTPQLEKRVNRVFFKLGLGAETAAVEPKSRAEKEKKIAEDYNKFKFKGMKGLQ